MSDDQTFEGRLQRRRLAAMDEFEADGRAKAQAVLDAWWQEKLDAAAEARRREHELNPFGQRIW
jgi:hypothetical protein